MTVLVRKDTRAKWEAAAGIDRQKVPADAVNAGPQPVADKISFWKRLLLCRVTQARPEIPADAVTTDLRTTANKLSFWKCGAAADEELRRVVLALASAAERVDKVDIVWVAKASLEARGVALEDSDGRTPIADMVKKHMDALRLDLVPLGKVAQQVAEALHQGQHRRLTRKEVLRILADAVQAKVVEVGALEEKVREDVEREIEARRPKAGGR